MTQRRLNKWYGVGPTVLILTAALLMSGCIGGDDGGGKPKGAKIKVEGLDSAITAPYNQSVYYNFTVTSALSKDTVMNISSIEWSDVLDVGAKSPQVVFYVDEPLSTNGSERKYIGNSTAKAFFPKGYSINVTMIIINTDKNFRSASLEFDIVAFYPSGDKAASKHMKVLVRYM